MPEIKVGDNLGDISAPMPCVLQASFY